MNFVKLNSLVWWLLIGNGILSVTSILLVKTGTAISSPSEKLPDLATILYLMAE